MQIISYVDAKAKGLKRYFTGKPCKRGHMSERFVSHCGCIECAYDRTNEWGKQNAPIKFEIFSRFIDKNPGYQAKWVKENPESRRKNARKWYVANSERAIQTSLNWAKNNREKARTRYRNRLARKKGAAGSHTTGQILELLELQNWKCVGHGCCISIRDKRHIDHIMPLVLGGSNYIWNLQGLCPTCNCRKHGKHPIVWAQENGICF